MPNNPLGKRNVRTLTFEKTTLYKVNFFVYSVFKRIFDIIFSLIGIILSSPIMLIVAIAIKLDSEGPVLFKQTRTGQYGKEFKMYKFRSMAVSNDVHDFSKGDEHTKIGTFIRKTSLDELPQFFNLGVI